MSADSETQESTFRGKEVVAGAERREPGINDHALSDPVCARCPEQVNPQRQNADQRGRGRWEEKRGRADGHRVPFGGSENVLKLICWWLHTSVNTLKPAAS